MTTMALTSCDPPWSGDGRIIGLDPVFRSYVKIRIQDLHRMQLQPCGSDQIELFCFKSHFVHKVEITGIIVMIDRRNKYVRFAVDDGTGVILCVQWRSDNKAALGEVPTDLPTSLAEKWREIRAASDYQNNCDFSMGDLVQVGGRVATYMNKKEICVFFHKIIDDPKVELETLLDQPAIYSFYEQPFVAPLNLMKQVNSLAADGLNECNVMAAICQHIESSNCCMTTSEDILTWPPVTVLTSKLKVEIDKEAALRVIRSALQVLESKKGSVCQLAGVFDTFEIIRSACPMGIKVLDILKSACKNSQNSENGCHVRHLLSKLASFPEYAKVEEPVMSHLLSCLEASSDVVNINPQRFVPIS